MKLTLTFLLFCVLTARGATYYCSPTGDDGAAGTEVAPWKTLAKVHDTVASGDTVYFRNGTWTNEYFWPGKTTGIQNASFLAYPGETPVWSYDGGVFHNGQFMCDYAANSNLLFRGITISNCYRWGGIQDGSHITLDSMTFKGNDNPTNFLGFVLWNARYCVLTNCTFTRDGDSTTDDDLGNLLTIGTLNGITSGQYNTNCYGNLITDCTFSYGGHDCMELRSMSNVVRRCKFFNPAWMLGSTGTNLWGNRHLETMSYWCTNNLIELCDFGYSSQPVDSPNTVSSVEICSGRNIVRRNRFFDNQGVAVCFYSKGYDAEPEHNYVYHNSMLWSGRNATAQANEYWWFNTGVTWTSVECTNNAVVNNIIFKNGPQGTNLGLANAWSAPGNVVAGNLTNLTVDPLFTTTNTSAALLTIPNLNLQATSPAINAGSWLTTTVGASSGTSMTVADGGYFYDGWNIPGEVGDTIQLQGGTATARVTARVGNTLTLNSTLTWTNGQGVALAYVGTAPEIGAYEYTPTASTTRNIGTIRAVNLIKRTP